MLNRFLREVTRKCLLSIRATALGLVIALPQMSFADTDRLKVRALTFDEASVVVASDAGLWRLDGDSPAHFPGPGAVSSLTSHPDRPATLFATLDASGLSRSLDGGATWTDVGAGLPPAPVLSVTMGAAAPDTLYAAVVGDGIWRSDDAGESWAFVMDRPYLDGTEQDVLSLISVGGPTGMGGIWLYAGTQLGLIRVPDCFCRWQDVTAGDAMDALVAGCTRPQSWGRQCRAFADLRRVGDRPLSLDQRRRGLFAGITDGRHRTGCRSRQSPAPGGRPDR